MGVERSAIAIFGHSFLGAGICFDFGLNQRSSLRADFFSDILFGYWSCFMVIHILWLFMEIG